MKYLVYIAVLLALSACAVFDIEPPMQGRVEGGVYHHPLGHFTCPLPDREMGFDMQNPRIIDARHDRHWEHDPFSQDSQFKQRLVNNGVKPAGGATFRDGPRVGVSTMVKINPGGMIHGRDDVLSTFFDSGFARPLDTDFFTTPHGDAGYQLSLVPWYEPEQSYMGGNLLALYMADTTKPPPDLVAKLNVIRGKTHYHVEWTVNTGPILPPGMHTRDLPKILQYLENRPELAPDMRRALTRWFARCDITDFIATTESSLPASAD